jgi:BRCA1-associated protein
MTRAPPLYSIVIALHPLAQDNTEKAVARDTTESSTEDWRLGDINIEWMDFAQNDALGNELAENMSTIHFSPPTSTSQIVTVDPDERRPSALPADTESSQVLLAYHPPLPTNVTTGTSELGPGVVHLFKHPPPVGTLNEIASSYASAVPAQNETVDARDEAEGADGTLLAVLAVPAWMRPSDFVDFAGGWTAYLEGIRMIRWGCRRPDISGAVSLSSSFRILPTETYHRTRRSCC